MHIDCTTCCLVSSPYMYYVHKCIYLWSEKKKIIIPNYGKMNSSWMISFIQWSTHSIWKLSIVVQNGIWFQYKNYPTTHFNPVHEKTTCCEWMDGTITRKGTKKKKKLERSTHFLYCICIKKDRLEEFLSWIHFGITRTVQHQSSPVWNSSF